MDQLEVQAAISRLRVHQTYTSSIAKLAEQYIEGARVSQSKETLKSKACRIRQFVKFCNAATSGSIHDVDAAVVKVFLDEYEKTRKPSSVNALRKDVIVFLEWVRGYKEINVRVSSSNIDRYAQSEGLPKALNYEMVRNVIKNIHNEQDRVMIALTVEAGLRIGELAALSVQDISGQHIHVRGKGERERMVLITPDLAKQLNEFILQSGRSGKLWKNHYEGYGKYMTKGTIRKRMQAIFKKNAGIHMTPHQLRHTFAIMMLTQGCDIVTIKRLMGHKYIETTMLYLKVVDQHIVDQYKKYALTSILA